MYINKVDDLIDKVIDDFYTIVISNNKKFQKLRDDINFIKSQKEINDVLLEYIKTIPLTEITNIVKKGDSFNTILETLKRYISLYLFLTLGFFYKGKTEVFINNIIEFTRNQSEFPLKIDNFFNAESNSQIIKLFFIIKNILTLLSKDSIKIDHIRKDGYATETMDFIKELSHEFIDNAFRLKSLDNNVENQCHNIVKTLVILFIYKSNDKKALYSIIEQSELSEGEYMFIDIIEPTTTTINFNNIESLLSKNDIFDGLAYDLWNYIEELDVKNKRIVSNDEKINILMNAGIILPIIDDFLLYHRDSEKYDKSQPNASIKKKEETKVKYIIGKIDTTTELYSDSSKRDPKLRENIMKNFSAPLFNRKAILRNNIEEMKIINKFINQGKRNTENNDYFNDLATYRKYAYVNFKDFEKYGFSNHFNDTVTAVRAVNFDTSSEFKQTNHNLRLQLRVGSKDSIANIVGFMIPTNTKPLQCIKIGEVINIRDLSKKNKNGFTLFLDFLKKSVIKNQKHRSSVYWMFDPNLDSITGSNGKTLEQSSNINIATRNDNNVHQEKIKNMIAELYNRVVKDIYYEIIDRIDMNKTVTLDEAKKIIQLLEDNILGIPLTQEIYEDIEQYIFDKKIIIHDEKDILEDDRLYGLEGTIIKLPKYQKPKDNSVPRLTIDLAHVDESGQLIEQETVDGVCQHNITWDEISTIRKTNFSEYMNRLYSFIQQYVIENTSQEFICKSCGHYLDIKKYVQEGVFDDEKGFVTFSMPMEANLEDLPEYEKYQFSIKIMDKNVEKIASSVGIPYFMGNATTVKWRRKGIIKSTIDMVTQNNALLTKRFNERNANKTKMYGISTSLSNLFVFEMDNSIFQSSSKDKDQEKYKQLKRNNIITYIMIYLIMEMNESHMSFFTTDKKNLCDIKIFDKVYESLFSGLRIKKNNYTDTVDITKYKILCYLIYMISCRIAKHNLWYAPQISEKNIQKMIPIIQRYVVHTCVDCINSILENSFQPGVSYIFEIFRVRFYSKLNSLFRDNDYYDLLLDQSKFSYVTARKRDHLKIIDMNNLPEFTYNPVKWRIHVPAKFYPEYRIRDVIDLKGGVTNLTHCPDGLFHKWKLANDALTCELCKVKMRDLKYDESASRKIIDQFKLARTNILAQKFCQVDGQLHQYKFDSVTKQNICIKCKNPDDHKYTPDELNKIDQVIDKINHNRRSYFSELVDYYNKADQTDSKYISDVVQKNIENMKHDITKENPYKFIDEFINLLQSTIGNDIKGESIINLRHNIYIIDHDYNGVHLGPGKEIIITESENKINYKSNHPFFKTDVLYYTDKTTGRIDVFYDTITRKLLGYKESTKDYVQLKNSNKSIKINYSIYNKLKLLGYPSEYIDIDELFNDIKSKYLLKLKPSNNQNEDQDITKLNDNDKQNMYREIFTELSRMRVDNIKRTITEFQRVFNKILNNHVDFTLQQNKEKEQTTQLPDEKKKFEKEKSSYFSEGMNIIIDKYRKKINNISLTDSNSKHKVFKHWKAIIKGINNNDYSDKYFNIDTELIPSSMVSSYDSNSNMLLYYLVHEFIQLFKYNQDGFVKTNIANMLVEFIERIFTRYNTEHLYTNNEIRRFIKILDSSRHIREIQELNDSEKPTGIYEEYVDEEEQTEEDIERKIDDEEEQDAIDVDMDTADMEEGVESRYDYLMDFENSY